MLFHTSSTAEVDDCLAFKAIPMSSRVMTVLLYVLLLERLWKMFHVTQKTNMLSLFFLLSFPFLFFSFLPPPNLWVF